MSDSRPVLWHIPMSHYSEKARWALSWKGVEYERRAPAPPSHMAVALWLSRGASVTLPILRIDGRTAAGSADIVAVLDELRPGRGLIPGDPADRAAALELESFFDTEVGPAARLLNWHHAVAEDGGLDTVARANLPGFLRDVGPARALAARYIAFYVSARYGVRDEGAAAATEATLATALDRIEDRLAVGDGEHLVGERFGVADLTAAALLYPLVRPDGAPRVMEAPAAVERVRAEHQGRPAWSWVERTYATYRRPTPAG